MNTIYEIQEIVNKAKRYLEYAVTLIQDNAPDEPINFFIIEIYKIIDQLLESEIYLKEVQISNSPVRENFESDIKFNIEYLSKYIRAIEEDIN